MRALPVLAVMLTLTAGCLGAVDTVQQQSVDNQLVIPDVLNVREDGALEVKVPVQVLLVGFEPGTGAALQDALAPEEVYHVSLDYWRAFPPDPANPFPAGGLDPLPAMPTAVYDVEEAPAALTQELYAFMADNRVEGGEGAIYDANAVEDFLADALPRHGFDVNPDTPSLVFLHGGDALPDDHAYRFTYESGWLEPVRVFGERTPLLVMDASARPDPWVVGESGVFGSIFSTVFGYEPTTHDYDYPLDAGGEAAVRALADAAVDASHFRLLQGSIYPPSTKPCHGVTLIMAIRATAATERLPGYTEARDAVDTELLDSAWENVTGEGTVHVDLKVLELPQDDPVLEALTRDSATLDAFRWWLDENWDRYWVPHEGCEPYVSFLVFGDGNDGTWGIAMYDVKKSHRISFSSVGELHRFHDEYKGPGEERVNTRSESRLSFNWVNMLYAHETGHLLGQTHPHNAIMEQSDFALSFSSVRSAMSYQTGDRTADFGKMDHANFMRNRAGLVVQEAVALGLEDTPEFQRALDHLERYEWQAAGDALMPLVNGGST